MVLTERRKAHSRNAGVPKAKDVIHDVVRELSMCRYLRRPRVVSESTIAEQEEEVMGRELDYDNCFPCVVQWSMLWFSAPSRLNQTWEGEEITNAKYHEVVNMAITEAISMPFGSSHTPRPCMLTSVAAVLHRTPNRKWDVNREMKGWGMEGIPVLLPHVDGGDKEVFDE